MTATLLILLVLVSATNIVLGYLAAVACGRGPHGCWWLQLAPADGASGHARSDATSFSAGTGEASATAAQPYPEFQNELTPATFAESIEELEESFALAIPAVQPDDEHPLMHVFYEITHLADAAADLDYLLRSQTGSAANAPSKTALAGFADLQKQIDCLRVSIATAVDATTPPHESDADLLQHLATLGTELVVHDPASADEAAHQTPAAATPIAPPTESNATMLAELTRLFAHACQLRDTCEDLLFACLTTDHRKYQSGGRRLFEQTLAMLHNDARDEPLCAARFDLDLLDVVNQAHGLTVANSLLQAISEQAETLLTGCECVCRVHGQQFLCLLRGDGSAAGEAAERLRQQIDVTSFRAGTVDVHVTLSGAVLVLNEQTPLKAAFAQLDAAVQEAKHYGRNRTFLHDGKSPRAVTPPDLDVAPRRVPLKI